MDHLEVKHPFGYGIQTYGNGGHAVEKGRITLRRGRFRLLVVVALIITGSVETSGFIIVPDSTLNWAVEQLHAVLKCSLHFEHGVGVKQNCSTSDCVLAANHVRIGMNETANPCDDFYEFACGNWAKFSRDQGLAYNDHLNRYDPLKLRSLKPDSITFQPAKAAAIVYRHCINGSEVDTRDNIKTIIGITTKLGGWPSLVGRSDWNKHAFDLVTTLAYIFREYSSDVFFRLHLAPHGFNEKINVVQLSVPTLPLEDKFGSEYYSVSFKSNYANTLCEYIGRNSGTRRCVYVSTWWSSLTQDAEELIHLQIALRLAASTVPQQHSNVTNNQKIFTVEEIQKYLDKSLEHSKNFTRRARISWKGLLNKVFGTVGVEINDNQNLIVNNPGYFVRLARILDRTPKRIIANYVFYSWAFSELRQASRNIYQLATNFYTLNGLPFQSRESYCFSTTLAGFAIPVMHEYLKRKPNLKDRALLENMGEKFRATFNKVLESNTWLTDATKLAVGKKLGALKFFIGYPNWLLNATEIEGRFQGLPVESNFIETLATAMKIKRAEYLQNLGRSLRPFDEPWFRWKLVDGLTRFTKIILPSDVIPSYYPGLNSVVVPMGFIQPHQINSNVPSYVIYSRAGYILGHEILHGFDAGRRDLDENGQKYKSWTAEDELNYEEHAKCYRDQYDKFELFPGMYLNGSFGLDENIADNHGLKLAYHIYKEQLNSSGGSIDHRSLPGFETLSTEQMFFLSYSSMMCEYSDVQSQRRRVRTDPHSPRKFRVNGVLQNLPEFAHAWDCPTGAPMNPVNKCTLW